jgi:hypothetical protein
MRTKLNFITPMLGAAAAAIAAAQRQRPSLARFSQ